MQAFEKLLIEKNFLVHKNANFFKALIKKMPEKNKNMELFFKNKSNQVTFF